MIIIDEHLISDDLISEQFVCNLAACKGACCVQGDSGAPLDDDELATLDRIYPAVKPYLTPQGIAAIEAEGKYVWNAVGKEVTTPLIDNGTEHGPCAYIAYDVLGVAKCGIELAHRDGKTDFLKPISCHLYPIRINHYPDFLALNYDRWDICDAACANGKALAVPVYAFLREPLIRRFGEGFYEQLEGCAKHIKGE